MAYAYTIISIEPELLSLSISGKLNWEKRVADVFVRYGRNESFVKEW